MTEDWMQQEVERELEVSIREIKVLQKALAHHESRAKELTKAKSCTHELEALSDPVLVRVQCAKCKYMWSY